MDWIGAKVDWIKKDETQRDETPNGERPTHFNPFQSTLPNIEIGH